MDIAKFIIQLQTCSKKEFKKILKGFDVKLSDKEIEGVYPLLQEISITWLVLGVPNAIQQKLISILGEKRAIALYEQLKEICPSSFQTVSSSNAFGSNVFERSISISILYGAFFDLASTPTKGVSKILGIFISCG